MLSEDAFHTKVTAKPARVRVNCCGVVGGVVSAGGVDVADAAGEAVGDGEGMARGMEMDFGMEVGDILPAASTAAMLYP